MTYISGAFSSTINHFLRSVFGDWRLTFHVPQKTLEIKKISRCDTKSTSAHYDKDKCNKNFKLLYRYTRQKQQELTS